MSDATGVVAHGLGKRYGDLHALRDLDLDVPAGSVLGLLGHNGAGKTTAIRILTTLALPTAGHARVAGFDVVAEAGQVRARIGVAGQDATVDGLLTARANVEMVGRLHHLPKATARARADELLERFGLAGAAERLVKTFSGGMRRRVDLAASLVAAPPVLFLDEPTTGLDPKSRRELWDLLRGLVDEGTTLVLTTQYLEEADQLADSIVVLASGRIAATGSPAELKRRIGGERVVVTLESAGRVGVAVAALAPFADGRPVVAPSAEAGSPVGAAALDGRDAAEASSAVVPASLDGRDAAGEGATQVTAPVRPGTRLMEIARALDAAGVDAVDLHRREASLDDVFLSLTDREPPSTLELAA